MCQASSWLLPRRHVLALLCSCRRATWYLSSFSMLCRLSSPSFGTKFEQASQQFRNYVCKTCRGSWGSMQKQRISGSTRKKHNFSQLRLGDTDQDPLHLYVAYVDMLSPRRKLDNCRCYVLQSDLPHVFLRISPYLSGCLE